MNSLSLFYNLKYYRKAVHENILERHPMSTSLPRTSSDMDDDDEDEAEDEDAIKRMTMKRKWTSIDQD